MVFFFNWIARYDTLILNSLSNWKDISIYWFDLCSSKVFFSRFLCSQYFKKYILTTNMNNISNIFFYYFCCRRKALLGCRYFRKMNTRTEMWWKVKPIYTFVRLRYRYIKTSRLWFGNFELYFHSIKIHEKSVTWVGYCYVK